MSHREPSGPDASPLDQVEVVFALLVTGPEPLTFPGEAVPGLPARPIHVAELRLLLPLLPSRARIAVWRVIAALVRQDNPEWLITAVALAGPCLRRIAARIDAASAFHAEAIVMTQFMDLLEEPGGEEVLFGRSWVFGGADPLDPRGTPRDFGNGTG